MNKKNYVESYKNFSDKFIERKLSAKKFVKEIIKLSQNCPKDMANSDYWMIESLNHLVHRYEEDEKLRKKLPDLLDENQLRKKVKEYQKEIEKMLEKKND